MTISLDRQNKGTSVVENSWNLSTESITSLGIASLAIAGIATISGHRLASNVATFSLALTTVQTSVRSKKRNDEAQNDVQKLQEQVKDLENIIETSSQQRSARFPTSGDYSNLPPKKLVRPQEDNIGIFVDGANLSISAKKIWRCHLDWDMLLNMLFGNSTICDARYYDALSPNKYGLFHAIKKMGYEVISKPLIQRNNGSAKGNLDTELSNDMLVCKDLYDTFVLVSCDGDFLDTVKKLRAVGKRVELVSFKRRTNKDLINAVDSYIDLTPLKDQLGANRVS